VSLIQEQRLKRACRQIATLIPAPALEHVAGGSVAEHGSELAATVTAAHRHRHTQTHTDTHTDTPSPPVYSRRFAWVWYHELLSDFALRRSSIAALKSGTEECTETSLKSGTEEWHCLDYRAINRYTGC
jgi:hypothetical protein